MIPPLIVNENFPAPSVRLLRAAGVDVLAVQEAMPGASDERVLMAAHESGRWLVTFDRDYGELVFSKRRAPPPAILYLRQEPVPPTWPAERLLELLAAPDKLVGNLSVITEHGVRLRRLPGQNP
ncbi:MAG: hypothetical protein JWQ90_1900 [Hydrocarboniphaga sp.]|uniref:DUF5615 family PIN-like protein n=1 Tax=Hydrocarboniphaga sp. TaxID=2033016 RepID=UPI00262F078E|nr:DUF5615 family PIN-like protein [Hydrocarboniphaga sp.]MDB5969450.1 hypothetical protein [Hydrocarboniphaga sp.]